MSAPERKVTEGVILAAGMSTRAGAFKPGLSLGGIPMIARCMGGMQTFCRRIIVVGGYRFSDLCRLVGTLPPGLFTGDRLPAQVPSDADLTGKPEVVCIENPSFARGMFTSVKRGLAAVQGDRCLVIPADVPLVPPSVYRSLLSVDADIVVPTYQGRHGHPVLLSSGVIPHILSFPDRTSLKDVIRARGVQTVDVDAEEILIDIDTPDDYNSACQRLTPRA